MRIMVKDNPKPSFCNRSMATVTLSESEFEDLTSAIGMICGGITPSHDFIRKCKEVYLPKLVAAEARMDEKYKIFEQ